MSLKPAVGGRLNYRFDGPADATVLVLAHPLAADLDFWAPQLDALTQRFRVLRLDARGHGRSAAADSELDMQVLGEDVIAVLDELHIDRVHFCGLSIGGMTGMWLGAHCASRIKSVVLSNCLPHLGNREMWMARAESTKTQPIHEILAQSAARWVSAEYSAARPETVSRLIETAATTLNGATYAAYCQLLGETDLRPELARLDLPVLVLAGSKDVATPTERCVAMAGEIPGAQLAVLDGGHFLNWESPHDYSQTLIRFLQEVER